jgi:membrane protease YdiL (CAAX protease family)
MRHYREPVMEPEGTGAPLVPAFTPLRWGIGDAIIAWFVGLIVSLVAVLPAVDPNAKRQSSTVVLLALVGQTIGVVGYLYQAAKSKGRGSLTLDFGFEVHWRDARWLLGGGLVLLASLALVAPITQLAHLHGTTQDVVRAFEHASWIEKWVLYPIGVVVVAPLAEELLFRGVLLRSLMRRLDSGAAIGISALVFALVHVLGDTGTAYYVPAFLLLGLVSGWRAAVTGNLSQSILLHAGFNLLATVFILS